MDLELVPAWYYISLVPEINKPTGVVKTSATSDVKRSEKVELSVVDKFQKDASVPPIAKNGVIYTYFE